MDNNKLLRADEVAEILRTNKRGVSQLRREGKIACVRVPGGWCYPEWAVDEYVKRMLIPCQDQTKGPACAGSRSAASTTSYGQKPGVAANVALAQQTANKLKKRSQNSSGIGENQQGQVFQIRT